MSILCGCARRAEPVLPESEQTLKAIIEQKNNTVTWTIDVSPPVDEPKRSPIVITPDNIFAVRAPQDELTAHTQIIYPEIAGFGSLDTSLIGDNAHAVIVSFCRAVIEKNKTDAVQLMNPAYAFLLTIFFYDIQDITFTQDYVIGRAGMLGNRWEIPVRFFLTSGYIDMRLFLNMSETIMIDQITYGEINDG